MMLPCWAATMNRFPTDRRPRRRAAFTLIEALVSITIAAIAGSVLLMGVGSALQSTDEALNQTIAAGVAQQLLDEVLGGRYAAKGVGPYQTLLSPSSVESNDPGRQYDDIDDYNGVRSSPLEDPWGIELGKEGQAGSERHPHFQAPAGFFDNWREEIDVYYVDESELTRRLPAGQISDYRAVEVRIIDDPPNRGSRELVNLRQVVTYVPPIP